MSRQILAFMILSLFLLIGCKEEVAKAVEEVGSMEEEKGLSCEIIVPAGELYTAFAHLPMPPFFNIGQIRTETKTTEVLVLTSRRKKGERLKVDLIGLFGFRQDTMDRRYVLALPRRQGVNNLEREYEAYLTKNNDLKLAIESWFRAQCGLSICGSFYWDNSYKALLQLEKQ